MKKHLLLFLGFLIISFGLFAQKQSISGTVISADDNLGLPGVTIHKISSNRELPENTCYTVHNMTGKLNFKGTLNGWAQLIDLSEQSEGMYIIKVKTASENKTSKLILQ